MPLPDVAPHAVRPDVQLPLFRTQEYPIDVLLPDIPSPDKAPTEVPPPDPLPPAPDSLVEYLLPPSEGKGGDAARDTSSTPVDGSDTAGNLAPVDFTFPFPEEPKSAKRQPTSGPDLGSGSG